MKEGKVQNKSMYILWKFTYNGDCILIQSEKVDYSINNLIFFLLYIIIYLFLILLNFTLQYYIGFATHQHESAMGVHVFPMLSPLPPPSPYHLSGSSQCTSPKHPVSCIKPRLVIHFLYDIIHV